MAKLTKNEITARKYELLEELQNLEMMEVSDWHEIRVNKGLKPNKVTVEQLIEIIKHYFENDRKTVSKSFVAIYEANTSIHKRSKGMEVDWAVKMASCSYNNHLLLSAFKLLQVENYSPLAPLFDKKIFNPKQLLQSTDLRQGIKTMSNAVEREMLLIAQEEEIQRLRALLPKEVRAKIMKEAGMTIKYIAEELGVSTKTISRWLKKNKE